MNMLQSLEAIFYWERIVRIYQLFRYNRVSLKPNRLKKLKDLPSGTIDTLIGMAWSDRTPFELIEKKMGFNESEVILVMRRNLKPSSFRLWRARVNGRVTKHRKLLKNHLS